MTEFEDRQRYETDHAGVRWEADGKYTPVCVWCEWVGKTQDIRSVAATRARAHRRSKRHLRNAPRYGGVFKIEKIDPVWEAQILAFVHDS